MTTNFDFRGTGDFQTGFTQPAPYGGKTPSNSLYNFCVPDFNFLNENNDLLTYPPVFILTANIPTSEFDIFDFSKSAEYQVDFNKRPDSVEITDYRLRLYDCLDGGPFIWDFNKQQHVNNFLFKTGVSHSHDFRFYKDDQCFGIPSYTPPYLPENVTFFIEHKSVFQSPNEVDFPFISSGSSSIKVIHTSNYEEIDNKDFPQKDIQNIIFGVNHEGFSNINTTDFPIAIGTPPSINTIHTPKYEIPYGVSGELFVIHYHVVGWNYTAEGPFGVRLEPYTNWYYQMVTPDVYFSDFGGGNLTEIDSSTYKYKFPVRTPVVYFGEDVPRSDLEDNIGSCRSESIDKAKQFYAKKSSTHGLENFHIECFSEKIEFAGEHQFCKSDVFGISEERIVGESTSFNISDERLMCDSDGWDEAKEHSLSALQFWNIAFERYRYHSTLWDTGVERYSQSNTSWNLANDISKCSSFNSKISKELDLCYPGRWGEGEFPLPEIVLTPTDPDTEVPPDPNAKVDPYIYPEQDIYKMETSANCIIDGTTDEIKLISADVSTSRGSFAWSFNGTIVDEASANLINPGSTLVLLTINSYQLKIIIEKIDEQFQFGRRVWRMSGYSQQILLDFPYQPKESGTTTSAGSAALTTQNILPIDWTINWEDNPFITNGNWNIIPGTLNWVDTTKIHAILNVVRAAGAFIVPHRTNKTLTVRPRYKVSQWGALIDWQNEATLIIPKNLLINLSKSGELGYDYNKLMISAETNGVVNTSTITGSAGDKELTSIVEPLMSEELIAKERCRNELSGARPQKRFTYSTILGNGIDSVRLLESGEVIGIGPDIATAMYGIVTDISVSARMADCKMNFTIEVPA